MHDLLHVGILKKRKGRDRHAYIKKRGKRSRKGGRRREREREKTGGGGVLKEGEEVYLWFGSSAKAAPWLLFFLRCPPFSQSFPLLSFGFSPPPFLIWKQQKEQMPLLKILFFIF